MSYDVYVNCSKCSSDLVAGGHNNMTSNLSAMWTEAGCAIKEFDGKPAHDMLPALASAISNLKDDPYRFQKLNPNNGWGTYEHCIEYLERLRDACCRDPFATVTVSR